MIVTKTIFTESPAGCTTYMPFFLLYTGDACPEDRALLRSNPSAESGPEAKLGGFMPPGFHLLLGFSFNFAFGVMR